MFALKIGKMSTIFFVLVLILNCQKYTLVKFILSPENNSTDIKRVFEELNNVFLFFNIGWYSAKYFIINQYFIL